MKNTWHALSTMPLEERGPTPWMPSSKHCSAPCKTKWASVGTEDIPAIVLRGRASGSKVGSIPWGLPGEAQSMLVSLPFIEDLSFIDDILVKLLWLG